MTKETLAALLNGREYRDEITAQEEAEAKDAGLVVLFGASDDLAEFRGAICDEAGCGGDEDRILIDAKGELQPWEDARHDLDSEEEVLEYFERKKKAVSVVARFDSEGYSHTFVTPGIPYSTFDIIEDGEKYCRGIVFEMPK